MTDSHHVISLKDCPTSPNCVCTIATRESQRMAPITYQSSASEAIQAIKDALNGLDRVEIVREEENYLHAVFTSRVFRFRDDVEFQLDPNEKRVHFRSASRVGYSDLGANRKRMTKIVSLLSEQPAFAPR